MPERRINSLKSFAINCGPLSEITRGLTPGYRSLARSRMISTSASVIDSRRSPMSQETAETVQDAAKVVERRANIHVGNIDMPMLVRLRRLFKAAPFLRGLPVPLPQQPRTIQHPPHAGWTHRHDVGVQHHERQSPIAFQRILQVERNDRLLLPILQPKVPGNPAVMLVDLAVSLAPAVELAGCNVVPPDETPGADLGLCRPAPDEIHDLVPRFVRNPDPGQSSPTLFFRATCSAISSAKTSSFVWIFFSRYAIRSCSG